MTQMERNAVTEELLLNKLYGKKKGFKLQKTIEEGQISLTATWLNKNGCFERDSRVIHGDGTIDLY